MSHTSTTPLDLFRACRQVIRSEWRFVLLSGAAGVLVALVFAALEAPAYRAHAAVRLPGSNASALAADLKRLQSVPMKAKALARVRAAAIARDEGSSGSKAEDAINQASSSYEVRLTQGNPATADLYCESANPQMASDLLNYAAAEFSGRPHHEAPGAGGEQLAAARAALEQSEAALEQAQKAKSVQSGATPAEDHLKDLYVKSVQAKVEFETKSNHYESARAATDGVLAGLTGDQQLQTLISQRDAARDKLNTLKKRYTDIHPAVIAAQTALDNQQRGVDSRKGELLLRLRSEMDAAAKHLDALQTEIATAEATSNQQAGAAGQQIASLRQEVEAKRAAYQRLLVEPSTVKPADKSAVRAEPAVVLERATPPSTPDRPSPLRSGVSGLLAGLVLGASGAILLAFARA